VSDSTGPLESLLLGAVESAGNMALKLDPLSSARLQGLEGRSVRLEIRTPMGGEPRLLTLKVSDGVLHWRGGAAERPNAIVSGTLPQLAALLGPDGGTDSRFGSATGDGVRIQGDESLIEALGAVLRKFQPDLAGPLGQVVGTELADNLVGMAEAGIALLKSATQTLSRTATSGVRESFLTSEEYSAVLDRIDDLRLRTDRLSARIGLLEASRTGP
jgi:ubiquinone biosynthesis protein UbiJ